MKNLHHLWTDVETVVAAVAAAVIGWCLHVWNKNRNRVIRHEERICALEKMDEKLDKIHDSQIKTNTRLDDHIDREDRVMEKLEEFMNDR